MLSLDIYTLNMVETLMMQRSHIILLRSDMSVTNCVEYHEGNNARVLPVAPIMGL